MRYPLGWLLVALPLTSCTLLAAQPASVPWDLERGLVRIETSAGTFEIAVEIAQTAGERAVGLMDREELPENAGMLFLFEDDRPANAGFYMYRTWIPLDIAYADAAGRIVAILTMDPCERSSWFCPGYPPGAPYRMALEVNAGYFAARGIAAGDRLVMKGEE